MTEEGSCEVGRNRKKTARAAREQVGSGKSGMGCIANQIPAGRVAASLKFEREHQARELGLPVGLPWRVQACGLQIAKIDGPGSMRQAADTDDSWSARAAQQRHQPGCEGEVTQIVCPELHLKAIRRGLPARQRHHSRIVDQEIKDCRTCIRCANSAIDARLARSRCS